MELVRYGVVIVYSFGFGVPVLLYFVMKFLGSNTFSLPEVLASINLVNLYLWLLICMLFSYFYFMYHALGMVTLDIDGLWNGEFNSIFDFEYGLTLRYSVEERSLCGFWNNWFGSDYTFLDI